MGCCSSTSSGVGELQPNFMKDVALLAAQQSATLDWTVGSPSDHAFTVGVVAGQTN
jgi:hypothetical protein